VSVGDNLARGADDGDALDATRIWE